jgi:dynein heavy chain
MKKLKQDESGKLEQKTMDQLIGDLRVTLKKAGEKVPVSDREVFDTFISKCKSNFHIVYLVAPTGPTFKKQVKAFPALVNCTTMDWFHPWPQDALQGVANFYLKDIELDDQVKKGMLEIIVDMQTRIRNLVVE